MSAHELITEHLDLWTQAVTKKSTAGRGSNGKVELTGIKKLRELILELAVRGKLVDQDPNDEPAGVLLDQIDNAKVQLVQEGKIKKSKKLSDIDEEEKPFDLPDGWKWVRMEAISEYIQRGKGPKYAESGKVRVISQKCVQWSGFELSVSRFVEDSSLGGYQDERYIRDGDILWNSTGTGTVGRAIVIKKAQYSIVADSHVTIVRLLVASPSYVLNYISSPSVQHRIEPDHENSLVSGTTKQVELNSGSVKLLPVPLPPLKEQHRIVQKVDELMALCDRLEQHTSDQLDAHETLVDTLLGCLLKPAEGSLTQSANASELADNWARLAEYFDTLFTTEQSIDKLKQTILQLAVMGRLVEQDEGDEPAEKLLKYSEEEIVRRINQGTIKKPKALAPKDASVPYELPRGWKWEKLGKFTLVGTGATPSRGRSDYYSPPEHPWVTSGETGQAFIYDTKERVSSLAVEETNISIYPAGTLVVAMYGQGKTRGQISELKVAAGTNQACAAVQPIIENVNHRKYIKLCFVKLYDEIRENAAGGAQPNLNTGKIANTLIPLPPLAEQHRIVQKVDELMALCDHLKERLTQASNTRCQLAGAVVEGALN